MSTNKEILAQLAKCRRDLERLESLLSGGNGVCKVKKENASDKAAEALFEKLWALYPRKLGKNAIPKAKKRELLKVGEEAMVKAIENYKKVCGTNIHYILHGSTFFNTRYIDYLDGADGAKEQSTEFKKHYDAGKEILRWE